MPTFVDAQNQDSAESERLPLSFGQSLKTAIQETAISGPTAGAYFLNEVRIGNQMGRLLTKEEAKAVAVSEGHSDLNIPDGGMTDIGLAKMMALEEDRREGEEKLSRAGGLASFVGNFAGQFADPANLLLNFVPVVGEAREAKILAAASVKAGGLTGRVLARSAVGAVEGAVGGAMSAPLTAAARIGLGGDYTMDDAFAEIGYGALFGSAFKSGAGMIGEGLAPIADRSSSEWVKKKFGTESQEWRKVLEHDKAVAEGLKANHPELDYIEPEKIGEPIAPDNLEPTKISPPGVEPAQYRPSRGWAGAPFRREPVEIVSGLRDVLGERSILREAAAKTDPLAVEIVSALKANEGEIVKRASDIDPLAKAFDALAEDRASGFSVDEGTSFGSLKQLAPEQIDAARAAVALTGQPERMARMVSAYIESAKNMPPEAAIRDAIAQIAEPQGPAEKWRASSDQGKRNAEAIADLQAQNGALIGAESVIDADQSVRQAPQTAAAEQIAKATDPRNQWDAQESAKAEAYANERMALPEEDFGAMADEAEVRLKAMLEKSGEDAKFAKGDEGQAEPSAIAPAIQEIQSRFGADALDIAKKAGFEIVPLDKIPGLTESEKLTTVGMTVGKKSYLAADRIKPGEAASYFLHEYGVHVGMEAMLGRKGFADLQAKVGAILDKSPDLRAVVDSLVPTRTNPAHLAEERVAYLVQHLEKASIGKEEWPSGAEWARITDPSVRAAIVQLVREVVAKIKAYLYSTFPTMRGMDLSPEDVHSIAVRALQHGGEMERKAMFAETRARPEIDEIKAAKEASRKVREVYKKAYDNIAINPDLTNDQLAIAAMKAGLSREEADGIVARFRKFNGDVVAAIKEDQSSAELARYRATMNAVKMHEGITHIMQFSGNEVEGALALDGGSEYNLPGARSKSVDYQRRQWAKVLQDGAAHELNRAGLLKIAQQKEFSRNIVNALFDVHSGTKEGLGKSYSSDHLKIAEVFDKYQKLSLMELRRRGVDIGELKGRMLHQEHDAWALREFANGGRTGATRSWIRGIFSSGPKVGDSIHREKWIDFVLPLLDEETYDGRKVDREYLAGAYNLLAGFREPAREASLLSGRYSVGGVPGEAAKRSNLSRNMKFKGPDEWTTYQLRCGNPDIYANFMGEMGSAAKSIGLMEIYGPGGENTREVMHQSVGHQLAGKSGLKWQSAKKKFDVSRAVLNGSVDIPGNEIVANVMANTRNIFRSAILGGVITAQTGDFVNVGRANAIRFNRSASGIWGESMRHTIEFLRGIKSTDIQVKVLNSMHADIEASVGGMIREIEKGDSRGFTSNIVAKIYQLQGATWLNKRNRQAAAIGKAAWLGSEARKGWNEIEPTTRDMLQMHGFSEAEWELIRKGETIEADGRSYLAPEIAMTLSDDEVSAHIASQGRTATPAAIENWKVDVQNRLMGMYADEVGKALREPNARSKAFITGGTNPGTFAGEMTRCMWDVKSFAVSQLQQGVGMEMHGLSTDPRAKVRKGSASHYLAIANYMGAMTVAGYASYVMSGLKAGVIRKGLIDQDESEDDKVLYYNLPIVDDRVLFASMLQGGALPIYGDFLFADADRYGGGFMQTLAGPMLGKAEDVYKLWTSWKTMGDDSDPERAEKERGAMANQVARMLKGVIPGSNLWYSRHMMDRYIWWNLQEAINPAALDRLEKAAERRGDEYIFTRPTDARN